MWLTAVPYLQGVVSPWDADAPGFETSVTYSAEQVYTILTGLGLDTDEIPNAPAGWFGEGVLDGAGYVAQMPVCGQVFTGTRLRSAFSLRSAAFTVAYDAGENAFVFHHPRLRPRRRPEPVRRKGDGGGRQNVAGDSGVVFSGV